MGFFDDFANAFHKIGDAVKDAANMMTDFGKKTAEQIADAAKTAGEKIVEIAPDVANKIVDAAKDLNDMKDTLTQNLPFDVAKDAINLAKGDTSFENTKQDASKMADSAKDIVH